MRLPASAACRAANGPPSTASKTQDLDAVIRYHDAQTDDALLTRAVVQSALPLGGELAMPASFTRATLDDSGVNVTYALGASLGMQGAGADQCRRPLGAAGRTRRRTCDQCAGCGPGAGHAHRAAFCAERRHLLCRESGRWAGRFRDALARSHLDRHHRNAVPRRPRRGAAAAPGRGISAGRRAPLFPGFGGLARERHHASVSRGCACSPPPAKRPSTGPEKPYSPRTETYARACSASTAANLPGGALLPPT